MRLETLEERCLLAVTLTPAAATFVANEGASVNYNLGSFTESDSTIRTWQLEVDWGDGTTKTVVNLTSPGLIGTRAHTYADNGSYTVRERLVSSAGLSDSKTFGVLVSNVAPTVLPSSKTPKPTVSDPVQFLAVGSDPSSVDVAAGLNYSWDFGDGSPKRSGPGLSLVSYTYRSVGTFTVKVTATDKDGATSAVASVKVTTAMAPIPDLSLWQSNMLTYGAAAAARIAAPYTGSTVDVMLGNVYYDAERVFYQIADYTKNPAWLVAASNAEVIYRDRYVSPNNGGLPGYWMFPKGLAMDYLRTGDARSRDAVLSLAQNGSYTSDSTPLEWTASETRSREVAYVILTFLAAEDVGAPRRARLSALVDQALGHIDQWFVSKTAPYYMPFMVGLTAEALIAWYQKTGDPRVIPAVKTALNGIWNGTWDAASKSFKYINKEVAGEGGPTPAPDLNLLIAPAFAWLYNRTGEAIYRDRGDLVFAGGVEGAWIDANKQFNQNYRTSFDYVNWRSQSPAVAAIPATNTVTLSVVDQQPAVEGRPATINLGSFIDDSSTGAPWTVSVDWGDGTTPTIFSTTSPGAVGTRTHTYADDGVYTVTERVSSSAGTADAKTFRVVASNQAPVVAIGQGPYSATVSDALTLSATGFDASSADLAAGLTYTWDFGDGSAKLVGLGLSQVSHVFRSTGTFNVTVQATDKDGGTSPIATATVNAAMTAIGNLADWRNRMTQYGQIYANALASNPLNVLGAFDLGQVFYQIADYTGATNWSTTAANATAFYRETYVLPANGGVSGTLNFGRGLATDFQRSGNAADKTALSMIVQKAAYAGAQTPVSYTQDVTRSAEVALGILTLLAADEVGVGDSARLAVLVGQALGHVDQWFGAKTATSFAPDQVGKTLMALIRWGEATGDARVAPAVKTALDWLWANAWSPVDQAFRSVNRAATTVQPAEPVADLMIAPAFAWYYRETGDSTYRDRGDQVFSGGTLKANLGNSINAFSLNYIWSFDFVKWRSQSPKV